MFTKKFKLLATMVGLVAVLAMVLAVPGATQIPSGPRQIASPPHPASGIWDRVRQLRAGEKVEVPFGGLYIAEDATGLFPFKLPAVLKLRLRGDKVVLINSEGDEVMAMPATFDRTTPLPEKPDIQFSVEVLGNNMVC